MPKSKSFSAVLTRSGNALNWIVARLPFDAAKAWGSRGQIRVQGEINGFAFRTTLFPTGDGHHFMIVNKGIQKGARAGVDAKVRFRMEPDLQKREIPSAPELQAVLKQSRRLERYYLALTPSMRTDIARFIADAKQAETRRRRAEQAAERLLETMEAEIELPPILRQAFARNPEAATGWRLMPPSHRRAHLLGIFYYVSHASRMRRIEKAMEQMATYAERRR